MTLVLTDSEQQQTLAKALRNRSAHWGEFFLPTCEFYNQLVDDVGLQRGMFELFRWVGLKPHKVHAQYGPVRQVTSDHENTTITVPSAYVHFPFLAGAALAIAVSDYIVSHHLKQHNPSAFNEAATIHLGFGLIVLNGLQHVAGPMTHLYHALHQNWHALLSLELRYYRDSDYAAGVIAYAESFRLGPEQWLHYVQPRTQKLLGLGSPAMAYVWPSPEDKHRRDARRWWLHLVLIAVLIASTSALLLFVWSQRVPTDSLARRDQLQHIQVLYDSYNACQNAAREQQNKFGDSDIYSQQNLNTTKNRCQSIKNQYNAAVTEYNQPQ